MLSRVAERVYWMSRYLERLENTARVIQVFSHVMLDLPEGMSPDWDVLLKIMSIETAFDEHYSVKNERNVIKFLLADDDNPVSLLNNIRYGRENARTTREVFPSESWEIINELYHFLKDEAVHSVARSRRYELLIHTIEKCQMLTGLLEGSLNRDYTLRFLQLGRKIERADMTTRILDVAAAVLLERKDAPMQFDDLLWVNLLQSFGGLQSYRLTKGPAVTAVDVIDFMIKDVCFPRSIWYSLKSVDFQLGELPRSDAVRKTVVRTRNKIQRMNTEEILDKGLTAYLDRIQLDLIGIHNDIHETWFDLG